ncbi:MAG: pilus assembly protein [Clostridiaceae bacterium]|nr:pilus assembly protein [Clostridiaceae bacterium]
MKLNKKGQSMVEMALILPLIIMLFMGMVEFSRIFGSYLLVTHASREGARMASIGRTDEEVRTNVTGKVGILNVSELQIIFTPEDNARITGEDVRVCVRYKLDIYAPVISSIVSNPFEMEANTYMRVE